MIAHRQATRLVVSQRVDFIPERQESRDALDQRLTAFLLAVDALAYPFPNGFPDAATCHAWLDALRPDGIVLSGGNDLGERPERDHSETWLLDYAHAANLPVLGICRGLQFMAALAGSTLQPCAGHAGTRHSLRPADGAASLPPDVNSYHRFAPARCPDGYAVIATADDGHIEAIRHKHLPWEGWMWHPERESGYAEADIERARHLFRVSQA